MQLVLAVIHTPRGGTGQGPAWPEEPWMLLLLASAAMESLPVAGAVAKMHTVYMHKATVGLCPRGSANTGDFQTQCDLLIATAVVVCEQGA